MKMRQGAEIPDALIFKKVAEENKNAHVTITTVASVKELLNCMYYEGEYNRRKRKSWWRTGTMWDRRTSRE